MLEESVSLRAGVPLLCCRLVSDKAWSQCRKLLHPVLSCWLHIEWLGELCCLEEYLVV